MSDEIADLGLILGTALSRAQYLVLLDLDVAVPDKFATADPNALASRLNMPATTVIDLQELVAASDGLAGAP